ncbi:MAG: hypothetical protein OSW77_04905, partial [Proteobacteria bacterium]|nr:hypothetical protein [Pseudomonadota bacterium]
AWPPPRSGAAPCWCAVPPGCASTVPNHRRVRGLRVQHDVFEEKNFLARLMLLRGCMYSFAYHP